MFLLSRLFGYETRTCWLSRTVASQTKNLQNDLSHKPDAGWQRSSNDAMEKVREQKRRYYELNKQKLLKYQKEVCEEMYLLLNSKV